MCKDLWAFWSYDNFPGFLSSKVVSFSEDGTEVRVESYGSNRFKYFALLPGDRGYKMHRLQKVLSKIMSAEQQRTKDMLQNIAHDLFTQYEFPDPPQKKYWHIGGKCDDDPRYAQLLTAIKDLTHKA